MPFAFSKQGYPFSLPEEEVVEPAHAEVPSSILKKSKKPPLSVTFATDCKIKNSDNDIWVIPLEMAPSLKPDDYVLLDEESQHVVLELDIEAQEEQLLNHARRTFAQKFEDPIKT